MSETRKQRQKKNENFGIVFTMCEDLMMENILNSDAQVASFLLDGKSIYIYIYYFFVCKPLYKNITSVSYVKWTLWYQCLK